MAFPSATPSLATLLNQEPAPIDVQDATRHVLNLLGNDGVVLSASNGVKDNGPYFTTVYGISGVCFTSADQSGGAASVTDAPTSGQKLCVDDIVVGVDTAMRVDFKEETSGTVLLSIYMNANTTQQITLRGKLKLPVADKKLQVQTSAAGNIAITVSYHSEV